MQREIDILTRDIEDLIGRIGDKEPTDSQWKRLREAETRLAEYRRQLAAAEAEVAEKVEAGGNSFKAKWLGLLQATRDFTTYDLNDGMFQLRMGVRLQVDGTAAGQDDFLAEAVGEIPTTLRVRRGRLFAKGRFLRNFDYHFEYDFAADAGFKDLYIEGVKYTKIVRWRIGHFKEPFSLARQTSGNYLGFPEWAIPVPAIAPGRNWGVMLRHTEVGERIFWAVSATTTGRVTDDNRSNSLFSFTGRITGLPVYRDKGRRLVHLGVSLSARHPEGSTTTIAARPEARFAPFFIETGEIAADGVGLAALEFATVQGPWWVQVEALGSRTESPSLEDPSFGGGYVEVGWFLTGESRPYDTQNGVFWRLVPNTLFKGGNPFAREGNGGAIEFVARYSNLDLNDGQVQGGQMWDLTLGMNWYLNSSNKVMFNYIHSDVSGLGRANLFLLRYQFNP